MRTMITRQFSPAEMEEIRRIYSEPRVMPPLSPSSTPAKWMSCGKRWAMKPPNTNGPTAAKRDGLTGIGVPRTGIW